MPSFPSYGHNLAALLTLGFCVCVLFTSYHSFLGQDGLYQFSQASYRLRSPPLAQRVAVLFGLESYIHNLTTLDSRPGLANRAIDSGIYICKGDRALTMITQDPPSSKIWTQQDLHNGWVLDRSEGFVSEDLEPVLEDLEVPYSPDAVYLVAADQTEAFRGQDGRQYVSTTCHTLSALRRVFSQLYEQLLIDYTQRATAGSYENEYIPSGQKSTIIAKNNYSPTYRSPGQPVPPLWRWSDVVWLLWSQIAGNQFAGQLRYIIRDDVRNPISRAVIEHVAGAMPDELDLPYPGNVYDMRSDAGKALLGTPHGIGIAYLIKDHRDVLERKSPAVRVFSVRNPDRTASPKWVYYMVWELRATIDG